MSLGLRFCMSRKSGTGGGGWALPKGANSMAVSGFHGRKALVGTGRVISVVFGINGLRNQPSCLVAPPFALFMARFSAMAGWHFLGDLIATLLDLYQPMMHMCRETFSFMMSHRYPAICPWDSNYWCKE